VWSEITKLQPGAIVRDRLDFKYKNNYGILLSVDKEMNANLMWVMPGEDNGKTSGILISPTHSVPLFNLVEKDEYQFLSRVSQCPLVHSEGKFQIGVVVGIKSSTGEYVPKQVRTGTACLTSFSATLRKIKLYSSQGFSMQVEVKLPNGTSTFHKPHELTHYKCDVLYCPKERRWVSWYEHVIPPSGIVIVDPSPIPDAPNEPCNLDECLSVPIIPRKRLDFTDDVPADNIFATEDVVPRVRETQFRRAVEKEVAEMEDPDEKKIQLNRGYGWMMGLPEGIWVEYYLNRGV